MNRVKNIWFYRRTMLFVALGISYVFSSMENVCVSESNHFSESLCLLFNSYIFDLSWTPVDFIPQTLSDGSNIIISWIKSNIILIKLHNLICVCVCVCVGGWWGFILGFCLWQAACAVVWGFFSPWLFKGAPLVHELIMLLIQSRVTTLHSQFFLISLIQLLSFFFFLSLLSYCGLCVPFRRPKLKSGSDVHLYCHFSSRYAQRHMEI